MAVVATEVNVWGEFERILDEKGRVIIPSELRAPLRQEFIVTRGPEGAILVLPALTWNQIEHRLRTAVLHRNASFLQRMLSGRMCVQLDRQHRLALPKHLRDWAGLNPGDTVVIMGLGTKIEVWSKAKWDAYTQTFTNENVYSAAESIGLGELFKI
jgi:MraZ protein